ncbi:MAG: MFS transporter [Acidobacteriota bacterium]
MRRRHGVLALLILLFAITYLDRVCISIAGPRMQAELGIDSIGWGWVTGMFTLAYCLFEIPTGLLGDRIGPRRVLTRVVLWWSAFTSLTGMVSNYYLLLAARFCFGAGEAGVFPNSSVVVSRWFPSTQRATISGVTIMAAQLGGALAPLLVVPIQMRYGWRASFYIFGALGVVWAAVWFGWFRDSPAQARGVSPEELAETQGQQQKSSHRFPWSVGLRTPTILYMLAVSFCYACVFNLFQTWLHTFLVKGRGFSESDLSASAIPYVFAICTTFIGGLASDALVKRFGAKWGRRTLGVVGLSCAGSAAVAAMFTHHQGMTIVLLSLIYGGITFQQGGMFGASLDIGQDYAGAMVGLMNMSAQVGGLCSTVAYGYIVQGFRSYDAPFVPMAAVLFLGAALWLKIDASIKLPSAGVSA